MIVDLNQYFSQEEQSLYVRDFLEAGIFDGDRFLLVLIVKSTELLYLNATTWQEFADSEGYTVEALAAWEDIYETAKA